MESNTSVSSPEYNYIFENKGIAYINPFLRTEDIPYAVFSDFEPINAPLPQLWHTVEKSIAQGDYQGVLSNAATIQEVANDHENPLYRVKAAMLEANLGLLASRAARTGPQAVNKAHIYGSYRRMSNVLDNVLSGAFDGLEETNAAGSIAEMVAFCSIARVKSLRYIPYLGSTREDASPVKKHNYDMYTLHNLRKPKVAMQVKGRYHRFSKGAAPIPFIGKIGVDKLIKSAKLKDDLLQTTEVAKLIASEHREPFTPGDAPDQALRRLSDAAILSFQAHRKKLISRTNLHTYPYIVQSSREFRRDLGE